MTKTMTSTLVRAAGATAVASTALFTPSAPAEADTPARVCEGEGCSEAEIACGQVYAVYVCQGKGEAYRYNSGTRVVIDYHLYGPGFTILDSDRVECGTRRPCTITSKVVPGVPGNEYAMCVWTWKSGVNTQPKACAHIVAK